MGNRKDSTRNRQVSTACKSDDVITLEFMMACMIVGLEYMHNNGVIHRDIKPENIVMDEHGYVRITDLGIARIWSPENSQDTSGTPGYMGKQLL